MFTAYPSYWPYRTLLRTSPVMRGEDVYALQTSLSALGFTPGVHDGILGANTDAAIRAAQKALGITVDGAAGGQTQTAIVKRLANKQEFLHSLPVNLMYGQCMYESGCRVGNYSPRRSDSTYDAGVAQRNTYYTPAEQGFMVEPSLIALAERIRMYFRKFAGLPTRRRWELAAGAWNAPAYACWIAKTEGATGVSWGETVRPSDSARATFEQYMKSATAFMVL